MLTVVDVIVLAVTNLFHISRTSVHPVSYAATVIITIALSDDDGIDITVDSVEDTVLPRVHRFTVNLSPVF